MARGIGAFKAQAVQANFSSMTRQTNSIECTLFPAVAAPSRPKSCDSKMLLVSRIADRPTNRERNIVFKLGRVMRNSFSNVDRPMCPTCKHRMGLARISPGKRGYEERTFECSTCHRIEKTSFAVDPLKTDAPGWLAGELKPPR